MSASPSPEVRLREWIEQALVHSPVQCDAATRSRYLELTEALARSAVDGAFDWREIPAHVARAFGSCGWEWNGIYALTSDRAQLHLFAAAGPPVCATIERVGGVGTSGMCFDAVLMNQCVATNDVDHWPGYFSCDGESGLRTQAGLVVPIRDRDGHVLAVWDVDSAQPLAAADSFFFERLWTTLTAVFEPTAETFHE